MLDAPIARVENLRVEFQTKQGLVVGVEDWIEILEALVKLDGSVLHLKVTL